MAVPAAVSLLPLADFPMVQPGDDLAAQILQSASVTGIELADGDVVVVTSKIVSKAEGRVFDLRDVEPSARAERFASFTDKDPAMVELVLRESTDVIRARPGVLLVRHRLGFISAAAGIDRSNVGAADENIVLLLPEDPDASADRLRTELEQATGARVGVILTDSHGRPFRRGNAGVAIGVSGITALHQLEEQPDLFGRPLGPTSQVPIGDLLASAAILVGGEAAEGVPVVVVRGLKVQGDGRSQDLQRPPEQDLFGYPDAYYL